MKIESSTKKNQHNDGIHPSLLALPLWNASGQPTGFQKSIEKLTDISCATLPRFLRKPLFHITDICTIYSTRGFQLFNQILLPGTILQGHERYSYENLKILYFGVNEYDPYIAGLMFRGPFQTEFFDKMPLVKIPSQIEKLDSSISAVLVKCDLFYSHFFEQRGFTIIPEWVGMTINLEPSLEMILSCFSKTVKEDIRRFQRHGYSYDIMNDDASLNLFYHKMYLPFIKMRHQHKAILVSRATMKHLLETGSNLMMIKRDGEYISGLIFNIEKGTLQTKFMGIKEGKTHFRREGVGASIIYFSLEWAKEHGATNFNMGSAKPFLNDGLFRYKMKWAPKIRQADKLYFHDHFSLKILQENKGINTYLERNPFLLLKNGTLKGIENMRPLEPMKDSLAP